MAKAKERSTEVQFVPAPPKHEAIPSKGLGGAMQPGQLNQYNVGQGKAEDVPVIVEAPSSAPSEQTNVTLPSGTVRSSGQDTKPMDPRTYKHAGLVFDKVRSERVIKDEDGKRKEGTVRTDH